MFVLCAGMQKSGTAWYFNLINEILVSSGYESVRSIRKKYRLKSVINIPNDYDCWIGEHNLFRLGRLAIPHFFGETYVIKSHRRPTAALRLFIRLGIARVTYIYRDPRDVVISSLDHGKKMRESGNYSNRLAKLYTIEEAALYVERLLKIWDEWMRFNKVSEVLIVRYEDLCVDTIGQLLRFIDYTSLDISHTQLCKIVKSYSKDRNRNHLKQMKGLHFNKAVVGRFRKVMNEDQVELLQQRFGKHLQQMGYSA
jgi:hypothetical protein